MKNIIQRILSLLNELPHSKKLIRLIISTLAIFFIIAGVASYFLPEPTVPIQDNSWEGVTPGYKLSSQSSTQLGTLLGSKNTPQGTELYYPSAFASKPNTIIVDTNSQKVIFIKEPVVYSENHVLGQYTSQFGEPDLVKFAPNISHAVKAHIFLDEGLVVFAHVKNNTVEEIWYFEPKYDENTFLLLWGKELSDYEGIGETFQ